MFCGEGGASKGYELAGLELLAGVDLSEARARRHYAYSQGVIHVLDWRDGLDKFAAEADLIHASPPCQAWSTQTPETTRAKWPDLITPVRIALRETGKPFVIENVQRAPLLNAVELNGLMFPELQADWDIRETAEDYYGKIDKNSHLRSDGQREWYTCRNGQSKFIMKDPPTRWRIHRTRLFEVHGFSLTAPMEMPSDREVMSITTSSNPTMVWNKLNRHGVPLEIRQQIMGGVTWMTGIGIGESIPPAYAREVGSQFLGRITKPRYRATVEQVLASQKAGHQWPTLWDGDLS